MGDYMQLFRLNEAMRRIVCEFDPFSLLEDEEYSKDDAYGIILEGDEEEENYHTEEMRNMYGGVFSREFILFFGENLQYYITEESAGHEALTFSDSVSISDVVSAGRESRYDLLNDMVVSKTLQDEDTLIQLMEEYVMDECFTDKVFTCI